MMTSGLAWADNNRICDYRGSWYGTFPNSQLTSLATAHGASHSKGSAVLEVPGADLSFLSAVKVSSFRGTWETIDNRSFAFTFVGYGLNVSGQTVVIVKISGTGTFATNCTSITVNNTTEIFSGAQDPFGDEPPVYGYDRGEEHSISRMRVDPPAEPL